MYLKTRSLNQQAAVFFMERYKYACFWQKKGPTTNGCRAIDGGRAGDMVE